MSHFPHIITSGFPGFTSAAVTQRNKIVQGPAGSSSMRIGMAQQIVGAHDYATDIYNAGGRGIGIGFSYPNMPTANQLIQVNAAGALGMNLSVGLNPAINLAAGEVTHDVATMIHNTNPAAYVAWIQSVITACSGHITHMQVRNEGMGHWGAAGLLSELAVAYPAIKAADSTITVMATTDLLMAGTVSRATTMDALINGGLLDLCDMFQWHSYFGVARNNPEQKYAFEFAYLIHKIHTARPDFPLGVGETGWQTAVPTGNEYATPLTQASYLARLVFIARCIPSVDYFQIYSYKNDNTVNAFGIVYGGGDVVPNDTHKPSYNLFKQACAHVHAFTSCTAYTDADVITSAFYPGGSPDDVYGGDTGSSAWYIKGAVGSSIRLVIFHATSLNFGSTIYVECFSPSGTLSVQTIGGATVTRALRQGRQAMLFTLTDVPQVLYSTDSLIGFPEFET